MNSIQKIRNQYMRIFALSIAALALLAGMAMPGQAQTFTILDNFQNGGPGPEWAGGPLVQGRDGDLYGYSYRGGATDHGSLWKTNPAGTVSVLSSFTTGNDCQNGMTLGTDNNFYGTGFTNCAGDGFVFKMTPTGTVTVLHTFTGTPDGNGPGLLIQYTDGNLYGTTNMGGANNLGSVFKITPAGTLTTIYSFPGNGLSFPTYGLTVGNDGNFYGTFSGDSGWRGGIFRMTPAGVVTVLHVFFDTPDGADPNGLILGTDGNFYGTTQFGGLVSDGRDYEGTIYKMTPAGKVTILHSFNVATDYAAYPTAPLIQATDGNFYGVVSGCGLLGCNGLNDFFKFTPGGTLTVLQEFTGPNGSYPYWPVTQDTNGTIYGLAQQGNTVNGGVLFTLDISAAPFARLVTASGKETAKIGILGQGFSSASVVKFAGVTATTVTRTGTTFLLATVPAKALTGSVTVTTGATTLTSSQTFKVRPSITSFNPPNGTVGTAVTITGTGLTQATKVTFNGTSASFTVNSDTQITTSVPTGATTGKIAVTTKGGTSADATSFTVN